MVRQRPVERIACGLPLVTRYAAFGLDPIPSSLFDEPDAEIVDLREFAMIGKPPAYPTLYQVLFAYIHEHCVSNTGNERRAAGAAWDWCEALGFDLDARSLTRAHGRTLVEYLQRRGLKPGSVRRIMTVGIAALNHAKKEERIDKVPKFQVPPASPSRIRVLTLGEERALMLLPKPRRVQLSIILGLETGARARAIEELEWDRCNLETRIIDYRVPGKVYKNKRRAIVPINDHLLIRLQAAKRYHDERTPDDPYVIGRSPSGGNCPTYHKVVECWKALGMRERGMCRHVFRHTFATRLLEAGESIYIVAKLMGDTVSMVEKNYGHVQPLAMLATANKLH